MHCHLSPVLESPPEPASLPERKRVFCDRFYMINWFDGLSFRIKTTNMAADLPNIGYHIPKKELIRGKNAGVFDLGACEVARSLQAKF